ncbi:hypothetical protein [Castellaniella sp.]|uniref:hypothetical protein n=1 Tax=Castellaniella sp. TaxID=1955812 RepID=UPI002AFF623F|nr:hypothetical protein [Castellaniella sp.]
MRDHAAMMQKTPGVKHAEPNMISLDPGQEGELIWQFTQVGTVDFACLIAGHMEAGLGNGVASPLPCPVYAGSGSESYDGCYLS